MSEPNGYGHVTFGADALTDTAVTHPAVALSDEPTAPLSGPLTAEWADTTGHSASNGPLDVGEGELLTCPECGTAARVTLNRRDAQDFCRVCDYPLFWTPTAIQRDRTDADESLRRLPGTVGRATIASLACPHCAEPNALSAQVCVRCGGLMHPVVEAPPPPPEPVYVAPPPPPPEPEPERGWPWWAWALLGLGVVIAVTVIILYVAGIIG